MTQEVEVSSQDLKEAEALVQILQKGSEDYEAGRHMSLEEMKAKISGKFSQETS